MSSQNFVAGRWKPWKPMMQTSSWIWGQITFCYWRQNLSSRYPSSSLLSRWPRSICLGSLTLARFADKMTLVTRECEITWKPFIWKVPCIAPSVTSPPPKSPPTRWLCMSTPLIWNIWRLKEKTLPFWRTTALISIPFGSLKKELAKGWRILMTAVPRTTQRIWIAFIPTNLNWWTRPCLRPRQKSPLQPRKCPLLRQSMGPYRNVTRYLIPPTILRRKTASASNSGPPTRVVHLWPAKKDHLQVPERLLPQIQVVLALLLKSVPSVTTRAKILPF